MELGLFTGYVAPVAVAMIEGTPKVATVHRAIYHPHQKQPLEFLPDRNGSYAPDEKQKKRMGALLKRKFNKIQKACAAASLQCNSDDKFRYEDDEIVVVGTPNGSYGYMYMAAWPKEKESGNA